MDESPVCTICGHEKLLKMVLELRTEDFILGCDGSNRYIAWL